jgi:hypothetical protein
MSQAKQPQETEDKPTPPKPLRGRNLTARILRQKVWRAANVENDWCVFVIVGREGSGKSHTCLSILEKADPSFNAARASFDPEHFLENINDIPKEERRGKAVMLDEAGVGMGVRSWHDSDQINFNKVLQTARDDNMIIGMTLPRLTELDSQTRGRLHGFLEMRDVKPGEFAEFSWKNVSPSRDENDRLYKWYPRLSRGGRKRPVKKLKIGPPSEELTANYEEHKEEFKAELYQETIDDMGEDDGDEELSEREIADELIRSGDWEEYVDTHNQNGKTYVEDDMIAIDYDISGRKAGRVKKLLYRAEEVDVE